jgi:transcriptional regulator with XRE-family HTH domain
MDDPALARRIGERARTLRRERGLTLQEVSGRSGITLSRLGRIELGERELSVGCLVRLARALGVGSGDLLGEPASGDPSVALASTLPDDPVEVRRRVLKALRALGGLP